MRTLVTAAVVICVLLGCKADPKPAGGARAPVAGPAPLLLSDISVVNEPPANVGQLTLIENAEVFQFDIARLPGRVFHVREGRQIDTGISVLKRGSKPTVTVIKDDDVYHSIVDEGFAAGSGYLSFLQAKANGQRKWQVTIANIATSNVGDDVNADALFNLRKQDPPAGVTRLYVDGVVLVSCVGTYFRRHEGSGAIDVMAFALDGNVYERTDETRRAVQILAHAIPIDEISYIPGHIPGPDHPVGLPAPTTPQGFLKMVREHQSSGDTPMRKLFLKDSSAVQYLR
jgi:hypothetical protein